MYGQGGPATEDNIIHTSCISTINHRYTWKDSYKNIQLSIILIKATFARELSSMNVHDICYCVLFNIKRMLQSRGERIIWYSNNIRITNIHIRIRPQIETRILFIFVFVQKFWSEYYSYSYSSKNLGPNIIRIRIHFFLKIRILFT